MRRLVTSVVLGTAMLLGLASQASAQSVDAGGGFSRLYEQNAFALRLGGDTPIMTSGNLQTSVVGEFGLHFFDGFSLKGLLGGVRFASTKDAKAKPFGQVLLGGFFCCDDSSFGLQFGGGVDLPMTNYTLRVQGDIPIDFSEGTTYTGFRLTASIVFPLNR